MASTPVSLFFFCFLLFIVSHSTFAKTTSFKPKALVLPITKDPSTLQYITHIKQRTPLVSVKLTVDLGGQALWVDCDKGYVSSSYEPIRCRDWYDCKLTPVGSCDILSEENMSKPRRPGNYNGTCSTLPDNPVAELGSGGQLGRDVVSIQSTDGSNPGRVVSAPKLVFSAIANYPNFTYGLATGVTGMAGLGWSNISLPAQFSAAFGFSKKFIVCLPSYGKGVVFFGDGPYKLLPGIDVSKSLTYTPLIFNKINTATASFGGDPSAEYFIGVKSIKINGKNVPFNTSMLSIDRHGIGGTKISTAKPYTVLETTIYNAVINGFSKELAGVPKVTPIKPFGLCYDATKIGSTRVGPAVPEIDLELKNKVKWTIYGANSMVRVKDDILCLGFVDGGRHEEYTDEILGPRTFIVIGGHQLENNLLQFDLEAKKLGFSSSLLFRQTTCSNFNFTSKA